MIFIIVFSWCDQKVDRRRKIDPLLNLDQKKRGESLYASTRLKKFFPAADFSETHLTGPKSTTGFPFLKHHSMPLELLTEL